MILSLSGLLGRFLAPVAGVAAVVLAVGLVDRELRLGKLRSDFAAYQRDTEAEHAARVTALNNALTTALERNATISAEWHHKEEAYREELANVQNNESLSADFAAGRVRVRDNFTACADAASDTRVPGAAADARGYDARADAMQRLADAIARRARTADAHTRLLQERIRLMENKNNE